jgi:hypothetical protein
VAKSTLCCVQYAIGDIGKPHFLSLVAEDNYLVPTTDASENGAGGCIYKTPSTIQRPADNLIGILSGLKILAPYSSTLSGAETKKLCYREGAVKNHLGN